MTQEEYLAALSPQDRDIVIRTIIGEAANQGPMGWAGVASTIKNRVIDPRWPDSGRDVALQPKQFSAWNSGAGGNDLVNKYKPGDPLYEKIGQTVDGVWGGQIADPTGGAVYYYAPGGMAGGRAPSWWDKATAERGGDYTQIGGHRFAGKVKGSAAPVDPVSIAANAQTGGVGSDYAARAPQQPKPWRSASGGIGSDHMASVNNGATPPPIPDDRPGITEIAGLLSSLGGSAAPEPMRLAPMNQPTQGASLFDYLKKMGYA